MSKLRLWIRSLLNYMHGYAFGPVQRCRACGHTAYTPNHCP